MGRGLTVPCPIPFRGLLMATRRYGLSKGETEFQILEEVGAAVVNNSMEFTVDLASSLTKEDVLLALEKLENHIVKYGWPPA